MHHHYWYRTMHYTYIYEKTVKRPNKVRHTPPLRALCFLLAVLPSHQAYALSSPNIASSLSMPGTLAPRGIQEPMKMRDAGS